MQLHAMVIQLLVQDLRHLFIKRRQDLIRPFDQGHIGFHLIISRQ